METDPEEVLGREAGDAPLWPQVTICDSVHRSPWASRSPRTPRNTWIPGKDLAILGMVWEAGGRGGLVSRGEKKHFLPAAGVTQEGAS